MKKYLNKKGYTLTYAIIVIGLLLILTASVTFVAYYNYKQARTGGYINTAFYASDGALEEAITELNRFARNAEVDANTYVRGLSNSTWTAFVTALQDDINLGEISIEEGHSILSDALDQEFKKEFLNSIYEDAIVGVNYVDLTETGREKYIMIDTDDDTSHGIYLAGTGVLNPTIVSKMTNVKINDTEDTDNIYEQIVDPDSAPRVTVSAGNADPTDGSIDLLVTSNGTYHTYGKRITVDLSIQVPDYSFSVAFTQQADEVKKNDALNNLLSSFGDIVAVNGTTIVNGDIYAFGGDDASETSINQAVSPDPGNPSENYNVVGRIAGNKYSIDQENDDDRDDYGGVIVGYLYSTDPANPILRDYQSPIANNLLTSANAALQVNGDLSTRSALRLEDANASVTVDEVTIGGIQYKGNLFANSVYIAPSSNDARISVDKNMYLYSDLFIGGNGAQITVGNGEGRDLPANPVIGSFRPNSGEIWALHADNKFAEDLYTRTGSILVSSSASNASITANGVYLFGVARYNVVKGTTGYQTGESYTTYNNRTYYQSLLSNDIYRVGVYSALNSYIAGWNPSLSYDLIDFSLTGSTQLDPVTYRANHFFTLGYLASNDAEGIYRQIPESDKSVITLREAPTTGGTNPQYYHVASTGVIQFDVADANSRVVSKNKVPIALYTSLQSDILGPVNNVDAKISQYGYSDVQVDNEISLFNQWFNDSAAQLPATAPVNLERIAIYRTDARNVYINMDVPEVSGVSLDPNGIVVNSGNNGVTEVYKGTIYTEGDVFIYADTSKNVEFYGNIVAKGDIYLVGNGTKKIYQDENTVYSIIKSRPELAQLYHVDDGRQLSVTENSTDAHFRVGVENNSNSILITFFDSGALDGTNVIDSNALIVNGWKELD